MSHLNNAQRARLRRFVQLDLIDSWCEIPATEHSSHMVHIETTGGDSFDVIAPQLDVYLSGLAHGHWLAVGGTGAPRWRRSILSERGSSTPEWMIVAPLVLLFCALSVAFWGWIPLLVLSSTLLASTLVCVAVARALRIAEQRERARRGG